MAVSFEGVQQAFAIQAGHEVRVLVENTKVTDDQARTLSKDIARKVEAQLAYPGQIRVSVVRETRAVATALEPPSGRTLTTWPRTATLTAISR